jgi:hypothetical protein
LALVVLVLLMGIMETKVAHLFFLVLHQLVVDLAVLQIPLVGLAVLEVEPAPGGGPKVDLDLLAQGMPGG